MKPSELYKLWAPDDSTWSSWAKPVLFADHAFDDLPLNTPSDWRSPSITWAPPTDGSSAVVLDLSGDSSVWLSLVLAQRGFRPVPVFNGAAGPVPLGPSPLVDTFPIVRALHESAESLMALNLPPNAPPVFMVDAHRSNERVMATPGHFDNRWCVFPQDFPSANFLLSHNIRSIILAQENSGQPQRDLAHVLLRWQEAGLQILSAGQPDQNQPVPDPDYADHPVEDKSNQQPVPIQVQKPGNFRSLWYRAMVLAGLRRNSTGGFGGLIPEPSSSGGYG